MLPQELSGPENNFGLLIRSRLGPGTLSSLDSFVSRRALLVARARTSFTFGCIAIMFAAE